MYRSQFNAYTEIYDTYFFIHPDFIYSTIIHTVTVYNDDVIFQPSAYGLVPITLLHSNAKHTWYTSFWDFLLCNWHNIPSIMASPDDMAPAIPQPILQF